MNDQLPLAGRCPRCGRPLPQLQDLADTAVEAWNALRGMRLALPPAVSAGLALLSDSLPCHVGTCGGHRVRTSDPTPQEEGGTSR